MPELDPPRIPDDSLTVLEARLRGWQPSPVGLDRDRLLFEAGRASARSGPRVGPWQSATAVLALLSTGLGLVLLDATADRRDLRQALLAQQTPTGPIPERAPIPDPIPSVPEPVPPRPLAEPRPLDPSSYLALTRRLASGGGLDDSPTIATPDSEFDSRTPRPILRAGGFDRAFGL